MYKKISVLTTLYFLSFCFIFGNVMEGNRIDECGPGKFLTPINWGPYISSSNTWYLTGNLTYSSATSSGTSECKGFALNDEQRINYIATNFFEIQEDVAKGGGEYLDGLTTIIGCEGTNFKIILKEDYESIFNEDYSDSEKIYDALIHKIKNSELRNYCLDFS